MMSIRTLVDGARCELDADRNSVIISVSVTATEQRIHLLVHCSASAIILARWLPPE